MPVKRATAPMIIAIRIQGMPSAILIRVSSRPTSTQIKDKPVFKKV